MLFEPGTRAHYSNPGMAALAYAVTASLRGAPQTDIRTLLRERVMRPARHRRRSLVHRLRPRL